MFRQIYKKSLFVPCSTKLLKLDFHKLSSTYSSLGSHLRAVSKPNTSSFLFQHNHHQQQQAITTVRTATTFAGPMTRLRLQQADGVPPKYELIYRLDFSIYLIFMQGFNLVLLLTLCVAVIGEYLISDQDEEDPKNEAVEERPYIQTFLDKFQDEQGYKKATLKPNVERKALLKDMEEHQWPLFALLAFFTVAIVRIQRRLPVRIYASPVGNHRIAVYLSSLIPGRPRLKEFVAGTCERVYNKKGILWTECVYKDAAGKQMLLLPQFFRQPADFHELLKDVNDQFEEEDD